MQAVLDSIAHFLKLTHGFRWYPRFQGDDFSFTVEPGQRNSFPDRQTKINDVEDRLHYAMNDSMPPGAPRTMNNFPSRKMTEGDIPVVRRFPGAMELG